MSRDCTATVPIEQNANEAPASTSRVPDRWIEKPFEFEDLLRLLATVRPDAHA